MYLITAIQTKVSRKVDHTVFSTKWKSALTSGGSEPLFFGAFWFQVELMKNDGQNWNSGCIRMKIYDVHLLNIKLEIFQENCQRYPILARNLRY